MGKDLYLKLCRHLEKYGPTTVAFSGGVDSTLLSHCAHTVLGSKLLALTIRTPYTPAWEIEKTVLFAESRGMRHEIIELPVPDSIINNPRERCYLCKKELFSAIQTRAADCRIQTIIEGSNLDDLNDYRPGMQAIKELQIKSPLLELQFTKARIREVSAYLRLPSAHHPSESCLLSRIPYHTRITREELLRISGAEKALRKAGILGGRVRSHGDTARLELAEHHFAQLMDTDFRQSLVSAIKNSGYSRITLDLEGYRTGSMND